MKPEAFLTWGLSLLKNNKQVQAKLATLPPEKRKPFFCDLFLSLLPKAGA